MIHPLLQGYKYIIFYIILSALLGGIQAFVYHPVVAVSFEYLLIEGVLFFLLFGIVSIPLWMIVLYVKTTNLSSFQSVFQGLLICFFFIGIWIGSLFGIIGEVFPHNVQQELQGLHFITIVEAFLLYVLVIMYISNQRLQKTLEELPDESCKELQISESIEIIDKITVKSGQKISVILVKDIICIEAEGDYVMIYTALGKFLKEQTMKYFETHIPSDSFVRIHRSAIINIHCISSIQLLEKQNYTIVLSNGAKLKASNSGYKLLKQSLGI